MRVFIIFLFVFNVFAMDWSGNVKWAMNYDIAKQLSKQQKKPIFVDFALPHCRPCMFVSKYIYTDKDVSNYLNKNFINVFILLPDTPVPDELKPYFKGFTPYFLVIKDNHIKAFRFQREFIDNPKSFIKYLK